MEELAAIGVEDSDVLEYKDDGFIELVLKILGLVCDGQNALLQVRWWSFYHVIAFTPLNTGLSERTTRQHKVCEPDCGDGSLSQSRLQQHQREDHRPGYRTLLHSGGIHFGEILPHSFVILPT